MIHGLGNEYLYAVTRLQCICRKGSEVRTYFGTGFFIDKEHKPYLITNRHVAEPSYNDASYEGCVLESIILHNRKYNSDTHKVDLEECKIVEWKLVLPNDLNDDVACFFDLQGTTPFSVTCYIPFTFLAPKEIFEAEISVCDFIAFIGFPAVYDHKNNLPILRTGTISSDPRLDYSYSEAKDIGHVIAYEAFSKHGSSGSPVFALQKGFRVGGAISTCDGFYRKVYLIGINAGSVTQTVKLKDDLKYDEHQQLSYMYKSYIVITLIEEAEQNWK